MKEIEVKAKLNRPKEVKRKLIDLGCSFSEPLVQKDIIYLHKSLEFKDITRGKVVLRIRNSNGKLLLTLKKQLENELDNIEREITFDDFQQAADILGYMDYHEVVRVEKTRSKCKYHDLEICVDDVTGLGTFIEVEKMSESEDSLEVQKQLFSFLQTLGVSEQDRVFKGYDTLIEESMKKRLPSSIVNGDLSLLSR